MNLQLVTDSRTFSQRFTHLIRYIYIQHLVPKVLPLQFYSWTLQSGCITTPLYLQFYKSIGITNLIFLFLLLALLVLPLLFERRVTYETYSSFS